MARTFERIVTVLGSPSVGKSALTVRLTEDKFKDDYEPTIAKRLNYKMLHNGIKYDLTIFDTAGLDPYSTIPTQFITNTHGFILIYSINDRQSFETVQDIHRKLVDEKNIQNIPLILVGNKTDLNIERTVSNEEGQQLAHKIGATFLETSAKLGDNVQNVLPLCLNAIEYHLRNNGGDSRLNNNNQENKNADNNKNGKCIIT